MSGNPPIAHDADNAQKCAKWSGEARSQIRSSTAHLPPTPVRELWDHSYATVLDGRDRLKHLRDEFIIPTRGDLRQPRHARLTEEDSSQSCIYLCGNSLGLQPRRTADRVNEHLNAWAQKGVTGHFAEHGSNLPPFLHVDDVAAEKMAPIVGAAKTEVAVMETLTANLHLMMASFYRPTEKKNKIIIEGKAFPSDHYAVDSHIRHRGFDPAHSMLIIKPKSEGDVILTTKEITSVIDEHADSTALVLLPGIQYYTGQLFDIPTITAHAHARDILVGWDLAHAAGNVELKLHEWEVDFAVWCNYKYLNSGPGSIASLFVHEKHGYVDAEALKHDENGYVPRLSGWWGGDRSLRFQMGDTFVPIKGAAGFQLGNPCALALSSVLASCEVFALTTMVEVAAKSHELTCYLVDLLLLDRPNVWRPDLYWIITPLEPKERGAQISIRLRPGLLEGVMRILEKSGVVVDERKPDVVRVAPSPLYNTFTEVLEFVKIFRVACLEAEANRAD